MNELFLSLAFIAIGAWISFTIVFWMFPDKGNPTFFQVLKSQWRWLISKVINLGVKTPERKV